MAESRDGEVGILVVGAGACGFAAAIAAHDSGADAAIVEKLDRIGGNTALSTGSVPGAGTRFQRTAGIEDSADRLYEDLMALSGPHDCPGLTRLLADESAGLVEWLADHAGVNLDIITEYCHVGHSVPRLHAPRSRRGQDLLDDLARAAQSRDIPVAIGNPVTQLIAGKDGAVEGAVCSDPDGNESRIRARKVILATNGFAANRDLVRHYCAEIGAAEYFGALGSTGDAVLLSAELGAALGNMGAYQGYAVIAYPQGSLLSWTTIEKGGILVGADGRRFGNEGAGYSGFARDVMKQKGDVYAVFDQRIHDITSLEEEFNELVNMGGVKHGDTVADAAAQYGIATDGLAATIDDYNQAAARHHDSAFGRREFGLAPLEPPYYVSRVIPGLFHSQGGLMVDAGARVVRQDGSVIANLFAGGGAAAGISGREGGGGYASGNGLLSALGLGRIAGLTAAREIEGDA